MRDEEKNPRISVITICRNAAHLLPATIESVLSQTYPNVEYIVVDGASSDGAPELLKSYGDQITHWVSEPDGGIADAMNKGVRLSTGEIFIHTHAGDYLADPDVCGKIASDYQQRRWTWAVGGLDVLTESGDALVLVHPDTFSYRRLRVYNYIPHPATVLTRRAFAEIGPFDTSYGIAMDYRLWLALGAIHPPAFLPFTVAVFRQGGASSNVARSHLEERRARREVPFGGFLWRALEPFGVWWCNESQAKIDRVKAVFPLSVRHWVRRALTALGFPPPSRDRVIR
jgi:glycosyltransferase involved in cell wall biosynthesis